MNFEVTPSDRLDKFDEKLDSIGSRLDRIEQNNYRNQNLTKKEAAKLYKVCVKTLEIWMRKGLLPYIQVQSKIFLKVSDMEDLFDKNYKKGK